MTACWASALLSLGSRFHSLLWLSWRLVKIERVLLLSSFYIWKSPLTFLNFIQRRLEVLVILCFHLLALVKCNRARCLARFSANVLWLLLLNLSFVILRGQFWSKWTILWDESGFSWFFSAWLFQHRFCLRLWSWIEVCITGLDRFGRINKNYVVNLA